MVRLAVRGGAVVVVTLGFIGACGGDDAVFGSGAGGAAGSGGAQGGSGATAGSGAGGSEAGSSSGATGGSASGGVGGSTSGGSTSGGSTSGGSTSGGSSGSSMGGSTSGGSTSGGSTSGGSTSGGSGGSAAGGSGGSTGGSASGGSAGSTSGGSGGSTGPTPCKSNAACASTEFCAKAACGAEMGTCEPRPTTCPNTRAPVCGCDGVTYWNDCLRKDFRAAGAKSGICQGAGTRGCSLLNPCPSNRHECGHVTSSCLTPSLGGKCWGLPDTCPTQDKTYKECLNIFDSCKTECEALKAGGRQSPGSDCN